ncbi:unnamed protein product [Parnassius mnemosyne]|uniref:Ig-like domain-containing protein n=1 Tax=Parnassius mnemosyne TaxID=213953 RepID=A0AAV1K712_9NEOP
MCIVESVLKIALAFLMFAISPSATNSSISAGSSLTPVTGTVTRVSSVVGGDADLPCDSSPPQYNDSLLLVVWYRDDNPVYSYDTRVQGPSAHWTDDAFAERARWLGMPNSALHLSNVQSRDQATYRCRVDFQVSPTRNYRIALDIIELPGKPVIFDEYGKEIYDVAGPYFEGSDFKLVCSVNGGNPIPRVQWLQGETVLTTLGVGEIQRGPTWSLTLLITNATRTHYATVYTCTADNTLLAPPQQSSIRVDLYLRPLTVEIISREQPLSAGRKAEIWCKSAGARPPVTITWWLGGNKLHFETKQQIEMKDGNETQSLLQWTPLKEHNGQILACRAEHTKFNQSTIESRLNLNIYYIPIATMHFSTKINPNDIEEGDDVYFGCEVDANPPAYKVVWEHNDVLLQNNLSNGVILKGYTNLALRNVSRHQAGKYTCTASNVEGDRKSPPLHLQIVYKPLCRRNEIQLISAALQEPSIIECEVDGFPPPDTFQWTFNNSAGSIKIDSDRFSIDASAGKSVLTYLPVSEIDYGTVYCRATNLAGQQISPCVYTLLPATKNDPPTNCTVYNHTHDSLDLMCLAAQESWEVNWAVGGVLGAACTVALILCLALNATRLRHRSRNYEVTKEVSKNQKNTPQKRQSSDDRNPDLIPLNKGVDCPPDPPHYSTVVKKQEAKNSNGAHSLASTQTSSNPLSPLSHHSECQVDRSAINGTARLHREIVTTRTPLLAAHQESCV